MILDRAGFVGNDGATHHGCYDLAYLSCIPKLRIMAPSDELELRNAIVTAHGMDDGPSVVRYPRGTGYGLEKLNEVLKLGLKEMPEKGSAMPIGKGRIVRRSTRGTLPRESKVAVLSIGSRLMEAMQAAEELEEEHEGVAVTVADARWAKPIDTDLLRELAKDHSVLVTVEEGSIGGFGDTCLHFLALDGALDNGGFKFRPMVIPDEYFEAASQYEQYEAAGLNARHIKNTLLKLADVIDVPSMESVRTQ